MAIQGFFTGDVKIKDLNGVLKAVDGVVEVATDAGTVTSVGLTVGSTGTDVNVANSPITSSGNITLNLPTASATNRGLLSAADWSSFNSKQGTITLTTVGNSGPATLVAGTLNIPNYAPDLSGYVPTSRQLTINGTTYDLSANRSWSVGTVTSVGLTMPSAFAVSSSPVTGSGTIAVTGAGVASQYIRGDGTLANFPTSGGGGSSVSYYLNGSVNQGTFVGNTYYEMNKVPVIGAGTDFTINANGYIAQFITDAADPALLEIPAGNWNFEMYFSASSGGGTPSFYIELYKYNGSTFTLISSSSASPEAITNGTAIDLYTTAVAVPTTALALTDRLAIRVYVTHSGRTITLHTENSHLCQVITTFSTGITALNGLTAQVQYFQAGTSGTDFNIASATATHTFNLPTASATNRGALSSADWTTFNNKQDALTNPVTGTGTSGQVAYFNGTSSITSNAAFAFTPTSQLLVNNSVTAASAIAIGTNLTSTLTAAANNDVLVGLDINPTFSNGAFTGVTNYGLRSASPFLIYGTSPSVTLNSTSAATNYASFFSFNVNSSNKFVFGYTESVSTPRFYIYNSAVDRDAIKIYNATANVAIGNAPSANTDAGYRLDVNGTARVQGSVTQTGTSNTFVFGNGLEFNRIGGITRIFNGNQINYQSNNISGVSHNFRHDTSQLTGTLFNIEVGTAGASNTSNILNVISSFIVKGNGNVLIGTTTDGPNQLVVSGSETASSAIARGQLLNTTLVAAANNDVLVGLDINPTFTNGAFTGVSNYGIRYNSSNAITPFYFQSTSSGTAYTTNTIGGNNTFTIASRDILTTNFVLLNGSNGVNLYTYNNALTLDRIGTNSFFTIINQNVAIGTTTNAGFKLDVNGTARVQSFTTINAAPAVNAESALLVQPTTNNSASSAGLYGIYNNATVNTIASTSSFTGIYSRNSIGATLAQASGVQGDVNISAGTTTTAIGFTCNSAVTGTGTASTFIGYNFTDVFKSGSGAITRQIGIRIMNLTAGGTANVGLLFNNAGNTSVNGTWDIYSQSGNNSYLAGSIGIGTTSLTGYNLRVSKNVTGATTSFGIVSDGQIQSSVTNIAYIFSSNPSTQAATFNLGALVHYNATFSGIGAGNTINNQFGFLAENTLIGATNNYGFYGNIPSGTNRWNLYMGGTAANYMAGSLGIGATGLNGYNLRVSRNISGSLDSYGIMSDGQIQSDVTTSTDYFRTNASTQATAFTLFSLNHYNAGQGTFGASSAVTNQSGFIVAANMIGATNNFGFRGLIPAGTNRWNIYMDGTANNYMAGSLGIGATNLTSVNLFVSKTLTGGVDSYHVNVNGIIQSDVTSSATYFRSSASTAAATFTLGTLNHYVANQGSLGASSAITNQYGFVVNSNLTGATNNYGFYGNIASGTNRWNLYMNGLASNYMLGNTGIGVLPSFKLDVQDSNIAGIANVSSFSVVGNGGAGRGVGILIGAGGSSNSVQVARLVGYQETASATANNASFAIQVANSSGTLTEYLRINNAGGVGIGASTINASAQLQVDSTTKGFLVSRMTQAQRTAIASPATGLLVYQTDGTEGFYVYSGGSWKSLTMTTI